MDKLKLNLTEYQVVVLQQRLQDIRNEKADYSPDLTTEPAIRESCKMIGMFDGQIELLSSIIDEAYTSTNEES